MLKETADVEVALGLTPDQLNEKIKGADALIVRSATKVRVHERAHVHVHVHEHERAHVHVHERVHVPMHVHVHVLNFGYRGGGPVHGSNTAAPCMLQIPACVITSSSMPGHG